MCADGWVRQAKLEDYLRMGRADDVLLHTIKSDLTSKLGELAYEVSFSGLQKAKGSFLAR